MNPTTHTADDEVGKLLYRISSMKIQDAKAAIQQFIDRKVLEGQINELTNFCLPEYDHNKCIDKKSCIGYMNAQSDFDDEKKLRLTRLTTQREGSNLTGEKK